MPAMHGEPTVSTYHSYAGRLLRDHGLRIGVEPGARLLADATRYQLAGRVLRRAEGPFAELTTTVGRLIGELVALDGELSEHLVDLADLAAEDAALIAEIAALPKPVQFARDAAQTARKRSELASLVAALRAEKRRLDSLDFGDQLAFSARLALEHPAVGEAERDRYRVVLLDEYQDTSHAQKVLLRALFGGGHPVTAVGDPCQAIYGWRGASVANIDGFPEEFPDAAGAPARRYPLSVNNRSGGRLLDAANDLSAPLRAVHQGVEPLRPREGREGDGSITVALHRTADDELAWVVDQVEACLAVGVPAREIAVLTRIRSRFGDYHSAFLRRGIPLEVVGLGGLLHLPEVADLVATLEVLDDPTANPALLRLLTGPRWRIGPRDLVLLGRRAQRAGAPVGIRRRARAPLGRGRRRPDRAARRGGGGRRPRRGRVAVRRPGQSRGRPLLGRGARALPPAGRRAGRAAPPRGRPAARPPRAGSPPSPDSRSRSRPPRRGSAAGAVRRWQPSCPTPRRSPTWTARPACGRSSPTCGRRRRTTGAWTRRAPPTPTRSS